jgi:amino acid adenylation domain-containing protein
VTVEELAPLSLPDLAAPGWRASGRLTVPLAPSPPEKDALALLALLAFRLSRQDAFALKVEGDRPRLLLVEGSGDTPFAAWRQQIESAADHPELAPELATVVARVGAPVEAPAALGLGLLPGIDGFDLEVAFDPARVKERQVRHLAAQLGVLAAEVAADPNRPIDAFSLLTAQDRALLPDPTAALEEPPFVPLVALVRAQAKERPAAVALTFRGQALDYRALIERADRVAAALIGRGLGRGERVLIEGPRSAGAIVAVLGVLAAGGVVVLVEPDLPADRKALVFRESRAKLRVLIAASEREGFDLTVDLEGQTPAAAPVVELPEVGADDPAYVFFTSGSTGVPKAILGRHKSLSEAVRWQAREFAIGPEDRASHLIGLTFEPVLREIFVPLSCGARLCIPDPTSGLGASNVLPWLVEQQVSLVCTTPTVARGWLDDNVKGLSVPSLRLTFFGGEPLSGALVERWRALGPSGAVVNVYGTSESAFIRSFHRVPASAPPGVQPIGKAVPGTQLLVLGPGGLLASRGERGEICIRSKALPLGYFNDAALTEEKFRQNLHRPDDPSDRWFATGDLGSYDLEGQILIHGRRDDQLKIHGVRVEPAEINLHIEQHPAVAASIVLPAERQEERILVAFAAQKTPIAEGELREWLKSRLPLALIPSRFVLLHELPRTASGKIDRRALLRIPLGTPSLAPPPLKKDLSWVGRIKQVWSEILAVEVGDNDDFFEIGGDSFSAIRVVSRLKDELNIELSLRDFFDLEVLTPASLAEILAAKAPAAPAAPPAAAGQEGWNVQPGYEFWKQGGG